MQEALAAACAARFPALCRPRPADSHKGSYGTALIIGGAAGMSGAAVLAAAAAQLMGCGKTYLCFNQSELPLPMLPAYPEIMLLHARDALPAVQAIAAGCGMGRDGAARALLAQLLAQTALPLILDADALNLIAADAGLQAALAAYGGSAILTPHPLEAARLLACGSAAVQAQREDSARRLARRFHAYVVLKGHRSLIADPQGQVQENDSGNAGLATAGAGDVLSGMLCGLLAQSSADIGDSVRAAVWLHGAAAEYLGGALPLAGLLAGEIAPAARQLRHQAMYYAQGQGA